MHKTIAIYLLVQHYQYYVRIQAPYTTDKSVTDLLQTFKEQICYKPVTDELSVRMYVLYLLTRHTPVFGRHAPGFLKLPLLFARVCLSPGLKTINFVN